MATACRRERTVCRDMSSIESTGCKALDFVVHESDMDAVELESSALPVDAIEEMGTDELSLPLGVNESHKDIREILLYVVVERETK